jgi:hypothetical protein
MPSAATEHTESPRMGHALELGFETPRDLRPADSIFARCAHPGGRPRIRGRRAGALGGLAVETIPRRDGEPGAVVALAPRDVRAAPAELRLTGTDALSQRALGATRPLEIGSRLFMT